MKNLSPAAPSYLARPLAALALLLAAGAAQGQTLASFAAVSTYSAGPGSFTYSVAVADVNGDGRPDLVAANANTSAVGVLLGQAGGGFAAVATYPTGSAPQSVAVADMNGDGRLDIITANRGDNTASVLLGLGGGRFAAASAYPTGINTGSCSVAVADMNGDGRPDIVTANYYSNNVSVLLGLAAGGFGAASAYPTGGGNTQSVAVADMNGDGRPDIVTANNAGNTASVLLGLAGGGFAPPGAYSTGSGTSPYSVAVADVNGDGRPDIITSKYYSASVLLGRAGGGFATASNYASGSNAANAVAVADVNGDGRPDIITANGASTASVLLGQAGGGFGAASTYSTGAGSTPAGVAVADVNGDGRPDIVTANGNPNTVGVLLNTGTFTPLAAAAGASAADVALFPNPARGGFALRLPAAWGAAPARAELRNALGQVVRSQAASPAGGATLPFATEGLTPGVYVLCVQAGGHALVRRVVVE